jgi:hypothetical protein
MSKSADRVVLAASLTIFALLAGWALFHGLATGAIDGPSRGKDLVVYAKNPQLFTLMACIYAGVAIGSASLAVMLVKHRNAA